MQPPDAVQLCTKLLSELDSNLQVHIGLILSILVNMIMLIRLIFQNQQQIRMLNKRE